MGRAVTVATTQFACGPDKAANQDKAEQLVRQAAAAGAQIILLQELFEGQYWCQVQQKEYFSWAAPFDGNPLIGRFSRLAAELQVVLPVPFFERANNVFFNSIAVVDADGSVLGVYRKSHIPDGPGYQEKFYFSPGDTGFRVFDTAYGRLGVAICWDQWFPECARALALMGAEVIMYPSAIGSEPQDPNIVSYPHWVRTQQGHAAANLTPVVVSNRIGTEHMPGGAPQTFYGGSFIAGPQGEIVGQVGAEELCNGAMHPSPRQVEGFVTATFDLDACAQERAAWGLFRDRRPDLYGALAALGPAAAASSKCVSIGPSSNPGRA